MDLGGLRKVGEKTEGAGVGTNARMQRMMALDAFGLMLNEIFKNCARELQYKQRGACACMKRLGLRAAGSRQRDTETNCYNAPSMFESCHQPQIRGPSLMRGWGPSVRMCCCLSDDPKPKKKLFVKYNRRAV